MKREDVLNKAKECVCQSRQADYGYIENNFSTIADFWNIYLEAHADRASDYKINSEDVAAMMILLKVARIASGHQKADNWIDIAGYAACGGELEGREVLMDQLHFNAIEDRYLEPPEPKTLFYCDCCGNDIYEGEECYITEDKHIYCTECVYKGRAEREEE